MTDPSPETPPASAPPDATSSSPPWGRATKGFVAVLALLLLALIADRFQSLIGQIVVAAMVAYILDPAINLVDKHTPLRRGHAILITYLLVAGLFVGAVIALGVAAYTQTLTFIDEAPVLIDRALAFVEELTELSEPIIAIGPLELRPSTINWEAVRQQVLSLAEPIFSQGSQAIGRLAQSTVRSIGYLLFVFVISIYIAIEIPQLGGYVASIANQPGYRKDAERMMREFRRIWRAYLRGQVLLGLSIGVMVWLGLAILGVQNALALGLISGLLEFIPIVGPLIGAGAAIIVAFFQPSNYLGLANMQYALVVLALMIVIQQVENNIMVPRIVGEALDLHPLLVIIGVFMGASTAGILGAILAAPLVATIKLLSIYAWRKMFDLPPFPRDEEQEHDQVGLPATERLRRLLARLRARVRAARPTLEGD